MLEFCNNGANNLFPPNLQPLLSSNNASSIAASAAFSPLPSIDNTTLSTLLNNLQPPDPEHDFLPAINYTSPSDPSLQKVAMFVGLVSVVQSPSYMKLDGIGIEV
ncbi:hypothetical protein COCNU_01G016120 [Cocos nucifera]|uniref:Uncharacterized protein n=1 Tax=Cocos nucifera TaxID=13894 RepID=A0A8K0HWY8_COCNU|nr:hypothetical protein COCNU_01G016120 [Cocos nucifera]